MRLPSGVPADRGAPRFGQWASGAEGVPSVSRHKTILWPNRRREIGVWLTKEDGQMAYQRFSIPLARTFSISTSEGLVVMVAFLQVFSRRRDASVRQRASLVSTCWTCLGAGGHAHSGMRPSPPGR